MRLIRTDLCQPEDLTTQQEREPMINYRNGREYIKCENPECEELTSSIHGFCTRHYKARWYLKSVGRTEKVERTTKGKWKHTKTGYILVKVGKGMDYEHRVLAEKALGKPLPHEAIVHHTGARDDNHGYCKLVICPNQDYHMLIHRRAQELGYENY